MKRTFASILLVLSLSGCVDIDLHTRVGQDGSGVQHWQFTTTALLAGQIRQRIERDPLFRKKNAKISEQFKEGDFILTVEIPFGQVLELNANDHQVDFEKTGLFRKTYTYTETWKRDMNEEARLMWKGAGSFVPITLRVSVEMPGRIVDSDADSVDGNVAKWSIPFSALSESKTMRVRSAHWNYWVIGPLAFLVLAGAIGLVILISTMIRKPSSVARCASCSAEVAAGSIFCHACGSKLH